MNIALLELAPHGHYVYVESIARIFAADPANTLTIYTNERGGKFLQYLENQQIRLVIKPDTEGSVSFLQKIKNVDKLVVVTLEPYARELYEIAQAFVQTDFNCPIYYVLHNIDFWFQQSFWDKIRNIFYNFRGFKLFAYHLKVYFKYSYINPQLMGKVKRSNGRFVTMSSVLGQELAQYVGEENVVILPFSVYDEKLFDRSGFNRRLRVCVAGQVSAVRRDYDAILKKLEEDERGFLRDCFDWDFLGKVALHEGGQKIVDRVEQLIKKGYSIRIYKEFLSMEDYDDQLSRADVVFGNLILQQGATARYGKSKETGVVFTMIKAAKVGLLPEGYPIEPALKTSVITFHDYIMAFIILLKLHEHRDALEEWKEMALENSKKFTPLSIYQQLK